MHHSTVRLLKAAILDSPRENSRAESVLAALAFICWIINFWLSSAALLLIAMSLAIKPKPIGKIDVSKSNTLYDPYDDNKERKYEQFWILFDFLSNALTIKFSHA